MGAIFLRELRENVKWAAMICIAFAAMIGLRAWHASPYFLLDLPDPMTLLYAPLAGLVMGVAQSFFETRPDNWGFVVHRPLSRRGIFAAKSAGGLLLLYLALGLPCAAAAAWAARSRNLPVPFQGRMVLPMLADVLTAGCYYFAGILLTLRRARWLGTRVLPVGMAFVCSVIVRLAPQFWQACSVIAIVQCVSAVAAWGAFATAGAASEGLLPRVCLGSMIYVGAQTMAFFLGGILGIFETTIRWHSTRMDPLGNVVRIDKTLQDGELSYAVTDSAGRPMPEYDGMNLDDPANDDRFATFTGELGDDRRLPWPVSSMIGNSYRTARAGVRDLRTIAPPRVRLAFMALYDVQERTIDLYDPVTCLLVGRVGPEGFTDGAAEPAGRFPEELLNGVAQGSTRTLGFGSAVYWMELEQRRVHKIFTAPADDPIICAHELPPAIDSRIVVLTRNHLHLLDTAGRESFMIPLDADLRTQSVRLAILPSNHHLVMMAEALSPAEEDSRKPVYLEYAEDGKLVRRTEAPEVEEVDNVKLARTAAFGAVHPLAGIPLHQRWIVDTVFDLDTRHRAGLFYGVMLAGNLLAAAAALLLCRRYGMSAGKGALWTVGCLLIGPAGLVTLAGLDEWPAREVCAACGGKRLGGRQTCPACGAGLPAETQDGREIFEPVDAFPTAA
jgi:hypothetical protein